MARESKAQKEKKEESQVEQVVSENEQQTQDKTSTAKDANAWEVSEENNDQEKNNDTGSKFVSKSDAVLAQRENGGDSRPPRFNDSGRGDRFDERRDFRRDDDRRDSRPPRPAERRFEERDRFDSRERRFDDRRPDDRFRSDALRPRYDDRDGRFDDRREDRGTRFDDRGTRFDDRGRYAEPTSREYPPAKRGYDDNDRFGGEKRRRRDDDAAPNETVGIFNLSYDLTPRDLEDFLDSKLADFRGRFTSKLIIDRMTGKCKGYGFLNFESLDDAVRAKNLLDNGEIQGVPYRVAFSIGGSQRPAREDDGRRRDFDRPRSYNDYPPRRREDDDFARRRD